MDEWLIRADGAFWGFFAGLFKNLSNFAHFLEQRLFPEGFSYSKLQKLYHPSQIGVKIHLHISLSL